MIDGQRLGVIGERLLWRIEQALDRDKGSPDFLPEVTQTVHDFTLFVGGAKVLGDVATEAARVAAYRREKFWKAGVN